MTWSQMGSNSGPRYFIVQCSTDDTNFTDVDAFTVTNDNWIATSVRTASIRTLDLTGVAALDNQATVYVRLVDTSTVSIGGSTVGTAGSDRIDSVTVTAAIALPVEITSFSASTNGKSIGLSWNTATEVNDAGFEVERKSVSDLTVQGSNSQTTNLKSETWNRLGFIQGAGTSNSPQQYSYADNGVAAGTYSYRLEQIDRDGSFNYSKEVEVTIGLTGSDYKLGQNYPNPFNPSTWINFAVKTDQHATLKVYNEIGQEVASLFNGIARGNKEYSILFDASHFASGVYFYRLITADRTEVKRMLLMK